MLHNAVSDLQRLLADNHPDYEYLDDEVQGSAKYELRGDFYVIEGPNGDNTLRYEGEIVATVQKTDGTQEHPPLDECTNHQRVFSLARALAQTDLSGYKGYDVMGFENGQGTHAWLKMDITFPDLQTLDLQKRGIERAFGEEVPTRHYTEIHNNPSDADPLE
jgi:hypothetical protein